ncbi:phosphatase PAP2 family protein [Oharaeibacter diazotrophicus]|uniref:PAP2 superfamily protein n=1 Tax=Oharaeibacter diazotrophicus TaxID=1920512 RepID=A0A4V3CWJ2_9HYPH|nr:phosphatase PAP2 family protein [Oharaeibacter diazotrophicus]TDP86618.1 PAP2 superfamily protein [Oharaeibacter diazotrophicus]BBE71440.1 PAP2 superfamily protein [Pleomorphomonas sp. SM30]GLS78200.1 hypothetical protein GCM10007904_35370 [Oharaeibacter diazotrophicus]
MPGILVLPPPGGRRAAAARPFRAAFVERLAADRVALAALALYAIGGFALVAASDAAGVPETLWFLARTAATTVLVVPLAIAGWLVALALAIPARRSFAALAAEFAPEKRPRLATAALTLALLHWDNATYSTLKRLIPLGGPGGWDRTLADLDARLHGGDVGTALHRLVDAPWLVRLVELNYFVVWTGTVAIVTAWIVLARGFDRSRSRLILLYLFVLVGLGNVAARLFASAGPLFYGRFGGDEARFATITAAMDRGSDAVLSTAGLRDYLLALHDAGRLDIGTGISAFPSVHLGLAVFVALAVGEAAPRRRGIAWAWTATILFGSVHLGWHYAIDGYVSVLAVLAADRLLRLLPGPKGGKPRSAKAVADPVGRA